MKEQSYHQITVSEIVKRADVARRTFYRLYNGKDGVLHGYFGRLCQEYRAKTQVLPGYRIRQIAQEYFSFWYQYKEVLILLHMCGMDEMLYYEISRVSADVVKGRMDSSSRKNMRGIEYFADYSTGGFILLLKRWIEEGMTETPEQYAKAVSDALLQYIRPVGMR